jgi:Predicted Zn-dependent proteases
VKLKIMVCFFVMCLLISVSGVAYGYNLTDEYGNKYKWDRDSNIPVSVDSSEYNASWQSLVNTSINNINSGGANFRYVNKPQNGTGDVKMISRSLKNHPSEPLALTEYVSYQYYSENKTYVLENCVIIMNNDYRWSNPGIPFYSYDIQSAVSHELGHVAGLKHCEEKDSMMRTNLGEGEIHRFDSDDVRGLIEIYGTNFK